MSKFMEIIREYEKYGYFTFISLKNNPLSTTLDAFTNNIKYLRGVSLTEMFYSDGADFFGVPNASDLFTFIHETPANANKIVTPLLSQCISTSIVQFYDSPIDFTLSVYNFIKADPTNHFLFAYSTFPAMFCYFASEEFCNAGSMFIRTYISNCDDKITSEALVSSFFNCIPAFYSFFFIQFAKSTINFYENTPMDFYYERFTEILQKSLPLLTYSHLQVILVLIQKYSMEEMKFVIEDIFYKHYLSYRDFSGYFTQQNANRGIESFFKYLMDEKTEDIYRMFSESRIVFYSLPKVQGTKWYRGCPTIMSEYDLKLIIDIINSKGNYKFMSDSKNTKFNQNWRPVIINIFPEFLQNKAAVDRIGEELFGIQPEFIPIKDDPNFERKYKRFIADCEENGRNILDYVEEKIPDIMDNGDLIEYIYTRFNNQCCTNFEQLQSYIMDIAMLDSHTNYTNIIENHLSILFHRFSYDFISNTINSHKGTIISKVSRSYNLITKQEIVTPSIAFSMWCAAFDAIYFHDSEILSCDKLFQAELFGIIEQNQSTLKTDPFILQRKQHICSTAEIISHLSEVGYGQQLIFLSRFMTNLNVLVPDFFSEQWHLVFAYSLYLSNDTKIFRTFLFYISFIAGNEFVDSWGETMKTVFHQFSSSVYFIIMKNQKLSDICTNPTKCMKLLELAKKSR